MSGLGKSPAIGFSDPRRGSPTVANRRELDIDLGANLDAPPAYGEHHDQLHLAQAGIEAGAAVTDDGRVNINIHQTNRRFADLFAPALQTTLLPEGRPAEQQQPLPPSYIPPSLGGHPGQVPPPRLSVVVQIVGSRGDVQPFVALGKVLKETYGHRVRIATHATFQIFVEENGLEFFNIGGDPAELMAFMVKNPGLMPGLDALKSGEITKRRKGIEQILIGCWRSCVEAGNGLGPPPKTQRADEPLDDRYAFGPGPLQRPFVADAIIANPPSFAHIHVAEKLGIPLHMMFTMPWSPTQAFPHPLANIQSSNTDVVMTNYMSYAMVEMMTWQGLGDVINRFREKILDLDPISLIWAPNLLSRLRVPTTYCWSPSLIPKPNDWAREISVSGFYFLNLASSYVPDPELAAFLEAGPPPVYIGFGSIVVDDPNALTRMIFDAISISGVRALVSKGWGGIGADSVGIPDGVFMLGNCPHDWLFQRVSCVVHHGGAGTTAAGIKLGKPTVIVPFFGDQPFWGAMVARAGAGPDPIPYRKLTAEGLANAIKDALKPETLARAKELGRSISEEQGTDVGGKSFHDFLDTDSLRCLLAPSRAAAWRVRRTQVRLSPLAAAVLIQEGLVVQGDLKPYRSREYNTEGQPWDPVSGIAAALLGDVGALTMAIGDLPRELFRAGGSKKTKKKKNANFGESAFQTDDSSKAASSSQSGRSTSIATLPPESDAASLSTIMETATLDAEPRNFMAPETASNEAQRGPGQPQQQQHPSPTASTSTLTPIPTPPSSSHAQSPPRQSRSPVRASGSGQDATRTRTPSPALTFDTAMEASKGVARIVETGMKTPMNFCLGMARGFRNLPKLYNDESVRPQEKVTGFTSGLKIAGKEFGYGFYDGLSGLGLLTLKGAEKEGGVGAIKGFGKGLGGLVLKPAAGIFSVPAYAMQGVNAEIRNRSSKSWHNYIIASRLADGQRDLESSTAEERQHIINQWRAKQRSDLLAYYQWKLKEGDRQPTTTMNLSVNSPGLTSVASLGSHGSSSSTGSSERDQAGGESPKTGWLYTRHLSFDQRKKLHTQRKAWKKKQALSPQMADEDAELEHAIRESVRQTSTGNKEDDARVERAIRMSLNEMQKIAERARHDSRPESISGISPTAAKARSGAGAAEFGPPLPEYEITDQEYQDLIEEAVRQSMLQGKQGSSTLEARRTAGSHYCEYYGQGGNDEDDGEDEEEQLRRAIRESEMAHSGGGGEADDEEEQQVRRAIEESERAHQETLRRDSAARTKEEEMLERVKQESLAEEELRRQRARGKALAGGDGREEDDDDEELKRALEESLRISHHQKYGGPSWSQY